LERLGDLQISEDYGFQRREWVAQRIGWGLVLVLIVITAAGLFGHGPISWTTAETADGTLKASFERFGRRGGSQSLLLRADAAAATKGAWGLEIADDYVSAVEFRSISPQPDAATRVPGAILYTFTQTNPDADLKVTFRLTPSGLWGVNGEIRLAGHDRLTIEQFFFP
jgi:hypothetical protein